jgi:hypothetical protein
MSSYPLPVQHAVPKVMYCRQHADHFGDPQRDRAATPPLGAYGLRITGLDAAAPWMQAVDPDAPRLDVHVTAEPVDESPSRLTDNEADVRLIGDGRLRMTRGDDRVRLSFPTPPPAADLLHPYLTAGAALAHQWAGKEAFHAGAFAGRAGAALLIGGKEAGKSTTLAGLAERAGIDVLADDLAVIEAGRVLAGPRSIDLRHLSADDGRGTRSVRERSRARVRLAPCPAAVPVTTVVTLRWGHEVSADTTPTDERLGELMAQRMFATHVEVDHVALLELAAATWITLTRPRGPDGLRDAIDLLASYVRDA